MPDVPESPAGGPAISVIVCTRNRPDLLEGCLSALLDQSHPRFEVIVVDNAPDDDRTRRLCERLSVTYVVEPTPGLGRARNSGVRAARSGIVAFVDDDTVAAAGWLHELAATFRDPEVMTVVGRVEARELATPAQRYFEIGGGGMSKGIQAHTFHRDRLRVWDLIGVHGIGVGANMAFRRSALDRIGGFDPRLGAGTPARGAEDLDAFHRVLAAGLLIKYCPAALVWHHHRRELSDLRQQSYDSGCGFGVYLIRLSRNGTLPRGAVAAYALGRWLPWLLVRLLRSVAGMHGLPAGIVWAQVRGAMHAPAAYWAAYT